jgi:hypothetical protein
VSSRERLFTAAEVNRLVPSLGALLERLQRCALALHAEREAYGGATKVEDVATLVRARPLARRLVEDMDAIVAEIDAMGGQLKDLALGLVDFPAEIGGEKVSLCWQFGEPEVAFWHRGGEGFAGRRRLPGRHQRPALQ